MEGHPEHQQRQQQSPAVIIVQQPVVVGPGTLVTGYPFLRRGVKLNNGTQIGVSSISCLGVSGVVFLFLGLIFAATSLSTFIGIMLMLLGGGMLALCFKFCHKAKQDFDALPPDHPDRITYSTPVFRPYRGGRGGNAFTAEAYQLPSSMQIITSPNTQGGGGGTQLLSNWQLPRGAQTMDPSLINLTSSTHGNVHLNQPLGPISSTFSGHHVSPEEDKPPPYHLVCKNEGV